MRRNLLVAIASLTFCVGACCDFITFSYSRGAKLDLATCVMKIVSVAGNEQAEVTAILTDDDGLAVELRGEQQVTIDGEPLTPTATEGTYTQSVAAAVQHTVVVTEPTRGVEPTTLTAPFGWAITSPAEGQAASLLGFTLNWSNASPSDRVKITITQTIHGSDKETTVDLEEDPGSYTFTANDLSEFGHPGNDLIVTVTKTNELDKLNGFNDGPVTLEHTETVALVPTGGT